MMKSSTDRIHKEISLSASPSRVWRALTDSAEFGEWFGVDLQGPFRVGERVKGKITTPGYEQACRLVASASLVTVHELMKVRSASCRNGTTW